MLEAFQILWHKRRPRKQRNGPTNQQTDEPTSKQTERKNETAKFPENLSSLNLKLDCKKITREKEVKHTVPLTSFPASLLATHISFLGCARLAGGLLLQQELGLRPGELVKLLPF